MPTGCCAPGCTQRQTKGGDIHFYRFPKNEERRWKWIIAMKRMQFDNPNKLWEPIHNERLCSLHFVSGQPSTDANHPDYVPSRFNFTPVLKQTPKAMDRFQRAVKRSLILSPQPEKENTPCPNVETAALALLDLGVPAPKYQTTGTDPDPDPIMTELGELKKNHSILQEEYQRLLNENRALKEMVDASKFTYTNLNNSTMLTLTGLPSVNLFRLVLSFVCLSLKPMGKLCAGNILLMVLMKLKLGSTNKDLALRFKVAPTQVSAIINTAIPVIADKLSCLICWLPKDEIIKSLPKAFKRHYRKARVIIDCSELFIQRPSNLNARAETWSNYKHHNTAKFLIGIAPHGAVTFLSRSWGGRVSDKQLTAQSGFYDKLEPGDLVLEDRGFLIAEELAAYSASLAIPPFAKGKQQFSQKEVEHARRLSQLRIHVERAIERVKRFQILKNVIPLTMTRHLDSILTICCAITNVLPALLK